MRTLYIIGNGFDVHHTLNTRYQAFAFFLQDHYSHIYDRLVENYGLTDLDRDDPAAMWDPLWSEFEAALADFDFQTVFEDHSDLIANPASDDWSDGDWDTYEMKMEEVVEELTTELFAAFKEFILQVDYPADVDAQKLKLDNGAFFLNFNYTDTLERYYGIPEDHILYIHHKAETPETALVLGHGMDPAKFKREEPQPPAGADEEGLYEWRQRMADDWEFSSDKALDKILSYFAGSHKETAKVIDANRAFFAELGDTTRVIVLGHSLAPVDQPYLKNILEANGYRAHWLVSYYNPDDVPGFIAALTDMGLPENQIDSFKMADIQ
jgi:hypothetical protein